MREELTKMEAPLSANTINFGLRTEEGTLNISVCKVETLKSGTQICLRNNRSLLRKEEFRLTTHWFFYIETFIQWRKKLLDCQRKILPQKLLLIAKHPTVKEVDKKDKMLHEETHELVNTKSSKFIYYEEITRLL